MQLGRDAMSSRRRDEALKLFNDVLNLDPDQGEAYNQIGGLL